ncbi:DNA-binding protein [Methylolobus aquaticus]
MAITKEQIWRVADEMLEAGESPTLAAVRKKIGGGSFTTISEAIKEWRQRAQERAKVDEVVVPDEIRDLMTGAGKALWQTALDLARAEIDGVRRALEAREKEIAQERTEALALADQVSAELEQAQAEIASLKEQLAQAQAGAREARAIAAEREQRIQMLEQDLKAQRETSEKMFHVEREARAQAEKQIERLTADVDAHQREIDRLKHEYPKQFQKFQAQTEAVREKMRAAEEGRSAAVLENTRLQERTAGLAQQVEFLQNRLADLTGRKGG